MRTRRLDEYFRQLGAAARSKQVDVEALLRRAVEAAVEETLRRTSGVSAAAPAIDSASDASVAEGVRELRAALDELRREVAELRQALAQRSSGGGLSPAERKMLEELPRAVAEAVAAVLRQYCRQGGAVGEQARQQEPRWLRVLRDRLASRGYVFLHELPPELQGEFDPETARRHGLVVAPLAGDHLVATREAFEEFRRRLQGLKTSDEYEAEAKMGRYRILFRVLRGEGMLYYGGPSRGWVLSLHTT